VTVVTAFLSRLYLIILRRMRGISPQDNATAKRAWCTHDLCDQCQSLGLGAPYLDDRLVRYRIYIDKGSTCPLCLYLFSFLVGDGTEAVPTVAPDYVCVLVDSVPENWDKTQRRVTFYDETKMSSSTRHILYPSHGHDGRRPDVSHRILDRHTIDFALLKSWIEHCRATHTESCSHRNILSSQEIPENHGFKVIDCNTRQIVRSRMQDISYVALSYVWGRVSSSDTSSGSNCLPMDLPNTIKDAIKITLHLGFQYLWVDKYCINQSDEEDKRKQVLMMDVIYHAATVTVVAGAGADSMHGLSGMSTPRALRNTFLLDGISWLAARADYKYPIKQSPWFSRGWT